MDPGTEPFFLLFGTQRIRVQRHTLQGTYVYHIIFEDKREPLFITRALKMTAERWWTSVPEGRQKEAEQIRPLIADYIQKL